MKKHKLIFFFIFLICSTGLFGQKTILHQGIQQTNIDVSRGAVSLEKIALDAPEAGKVIVRFDGSCISTPGDLIVLAASNTSNWGVNDGNTSVEAINNDLNQNSFSHTRVYDVQAGSHTYYAVAQNYVETAGSGVISVYGSLTVEYIPNSLGILVEHRGISRTNYDVNELRTVEKVALNPTEAGKVIVRFDGLCVSSKGDRIVLAASNTQNWLPNNGAVSVEAYTSNLTQNTFSHTQVYDVQAGSQSYYAVAQNYVETAGDGIASIYGSFTVEFIPNSLGLLEYQGINQTNVNLRGSAVTLGEITINPSTAGKVMVRFDGRVLASPGDRIVLAASNTPRWTSNDGNVGVEVVNDDVNRANFSHTRVYDVDAGQQTFYAVGQNFVETAGDGEASIYANLTVQFMPNASEVADCFLNQETIGNIVSRQAYFIAQNELADLNNDGFLDYIMAYGNGDLLMDVLTYNPRTQGFDNFQSFDFSGNATGAAFVLGDVNNDGFTDIVDVDLQTDERPAVRARLNQFGDGFSTQTIYLNTADDEQLRSAPRLVDYDNDGDLDVSISVSPVGTNEIYILKVIILENQGNGQFVERSLIETTETFVKLILQTEWADMDNDGDQDLLINYDADNLRFLRLYLNDGQGNMTFHSEPISQNETLVIQTADMDNDGDMDLASISTTNGPGVYLNTDLTFSPLLISSDIVNFRMRVADVDHNGLMDILTSGFVFNDGLFYRSELHLNMTGTAYQKIDMEQNTIDFALGDLNRDNRLDPVTTYFNGQETTVSYTFSDIGIEDCLNTPPTPPSALDATVNGDIVSLSWKPSSDSEHTSAALTYNIYLYRVEDGAIIVAPDADLDTGERRIVDFGRQGHQFERTYRNLSSGTYRWRVQAIDNQYEASPWSDEDEFSVIACPEFVAQGMIEAGYSIDTDFGDYDNDGDLDAFVVHYDEFSPHLHLLRNDGGTLTGIDPWTEDVLNAEFIDLGDVDNDGDLDVLVIDNVALSILVNDNGRFTRMELRNSIEGWTNSNAEFIDYDNDGDLDITFYSAVFFNQSSDIFLIENQGDLNFLGRAAFRVEETVVALRVADFDGDGDADILTSKSDPTIADLPLNLEIHINQAGDFSQIINVGGYAQGAGDFDIGDFDADGDIDIVAGGFFQFGSGLFLFQNFGSGFEQITLADTGYDHIRLADYNHDGLLDIAASTHFFTSDPGNPGLSDLTTLYKNENGTSVTQENVTFEIDAFDTGDPLLAGVDPEWADVNGDGYLDLFQNFYVDFGVQGGIFNDANILYLHTAECPPNTRPNAPKNLVATADNGTITFSWDPASDTQQADNSLTYNLLLTSEDGVVQFPPSDSTNAFSRVVEMGLQTQVTKTFITNLPDGMYCFKVQAIDHSFVAGDWSETFCINTAPDPCVDFRVATSTIDASCGLDNGSASLDLTGGTPPFAFVWSNGETTSTVENLAAGTYSFNILDVNNCMLDGEVQIRGIDPPAAPSSNGNVSVCSLEEAPPLSVTVPTGIQVNWYTEPDALDPIRVNSTTFFTSVSGVYYAEAFDPTTGCFSSSRTPLRFTLNSRPNITNLTADCDASLETYTISFNTDTQADIDVNANAAIEVINNGDFSFTISNVPIGITVEIFLFAFESGCSNSRVVNSPECSCPDIPAPQGSDVSLCANDDSGIPLSVTVEDGLSVNWFDVTGNLVAENTTTFLPTNGGTYLAQALDPTTNCTSPFTELIYEVLPLPNAQITGNTQICTGESTVLTASGGANYVWSNFAQSNTISVSEAGIYTVTATDANGCTGTAEVEVIVNDLPSIDNINPSCEPSLTTYQVNFFTDFSNNVDANAGEIILIDEFGNYRIQNIPIGETLTISVSSPTGCFDSRTIAPPDCACPEIAAPQGTDVSFCEGTANPPLTVTVEDDLSVNWLDAAGNIIAENTTAITPTNSGSYFAQAIDPISGCTSELVELRYEIFPLPNIVINGALEVCEGEQTTLTAIGGETYIWNNQANSASISVGAGTYSVTGTDANGCENTVSITVTEFSPIAVSIIGNTQICTGESTVLTASGGASYAWSNFAQSNTISVSEAGVYEVTATDANGCTGTAEVEVIVNNLPSIDNINPSCEPSLTTYQVNFFTDFSNNVDANAGEVILIDELGNYRIQNIPIGETLTISVSSPRGCFDSRTIAPPDCACPEIAAPQGTDVSFCEGEANPPLSVVVEGDLIVNWLDAAGNIIAENTTAITPTNSGSYFAQAIDPISNCTSGLTELRYEILPPPNIVINGDLEVCVGEQTTLTAIGGETYIWDNQATSASITVGAGIYTVTGTDANGCESTATVSVTEFSPPIITITGDTEICEGETTNLSANGGETYRWSSGQTSQVVQINQAGTYTVTATDVNTCETTASVEVVVNTLPIVGEIVTDCAPDLATYQASFATDAFHTVETSVGEVTQLTEGTFTITDIPINTSITIIIQNVETNCIVTREVNSPDCSCPFIAAPQGENIAVCANEMPTPLNVNVEEGLIVNWLDATGNLIAANTTTFTPEEGGIYRARAIDPSTNCTSQLTELEYQIFQEPIVIIDGETSICEGETTTLIASGGAEYLWNTQATTANIVVSEGGVYSVTATDLNACTASTEIQINVNILPIIEDVSTNCATDLTSYQVDFFSNGANNIDINAGNLLDLTDGLYQIQDIPIDVGLIITGINTNTGCSTMREVAPPNCACPEIAAPQGQNISFCEDAESLALSVSVEEGLSVIWTDAAGAIVAENTLTFIPEISGTYFAQAIDPTNNCPSELVGLEYTILPNPEVEITGNRILCEGESTTLTASDGTTYLWNNQATTASIEVNEEGIYEVAVTDEFGCTGTAEIEVLVISLPVISELSTACSDDLLTYQIDFTANGSYDIQASNGNATNLGDGIYSISNIPIASSVSVTLISLDTVCSTMREVAPPNCACPTIAAPQGQNISFCEDAESLALSVSVEEGLSVNWTDAAGAIVAENTPIFTPEIAGTYFAQAIDPTNNCPSELVGLEYIILPNPEVEITGNRILCEGESTTLTASDGTTYLWNNQATTASIEVNESGIYEVVVTDEFGCTGTAEIEVLVISLPVISELSTACSDDLLTYQIDFTANGSYDIQASNGNATNLGDGIYSISNIPIASSVNFTLISLDTGCSTTREVAPPNCACPTIAAPQGQNISVCEDAEPLALSVSVEEGLSVIWTDATGNIVAENTMTFIPEISGTYFAQAIDPSTNCPSDLVALEYTILSIPEIEITGALEICEGETTEITASGGLDYIWDTDETGASIRVGAGTYTLTAFGENGCENSTTVNVTLSTPPQANIAGALEICEGQSTTLVASGGVEYRWSTGVFGDTLNVSEAGVYEVRVIDELGCIAFASVEITQSPPLEWRELNIDCSQDNTTYQVSFSTDETYLVTSTLGNPMSTTIGFYVIENIPLGTNFTINLSDPTTGCTTTYEIESPDCACPLVTPPTNLGDVFICEGEALVSLNIDVLDSQTAEWYDAPIGGAFLARGTSFTPTEAATYYAQAVDVGTECPSERIALTLGIYPNPSLGLASMSLDCNGDTNGTIISTTSGGTAPYTYLWSDGTTSENLENIGAGNYDLTLTDANACSAIAAIEIFDPEALQADITSSNTTCGEDNGSIAIEVIGGTPPYEFVWNIFNSELMQLNSLAADTYLFTITDAFGCTFVSEAIEVLPSTTPSVQLVSSAMPTCDTTDGNVEVQVTGGRAPYQYAWSNGATTPTLSGVGAGTYLLNVTDADGCTASLEVILDCITACNIAVGTISSEQSNACETEVVNAIYDATNEVLGENDILQFILHNGTATTIGNQIIARANEPTFEFLPAVMQTGINYYITAVIGQDDGAGNVNLVSDCIAISNGTLVIFSTAPAPIIEVQATNTIICLGDSLLLSAGIEGTAEEFIWETPSGILSTNGSRLHISIFEQEDEGDYFVSYVRGGCESPQFGPINIALDETTTGVSAGANQILCGDTETVLEGVLPPDAIGRWATTSPARIESPESATTRISNLRPGAYNTFYWSVYTDACTALDTVSIYYMPEPELEDKEYEMDANNIAILLNKDFLLDGDVRLLPNGIVDFDILEQPEMGFVVDTTGGILYQRDLDQVDDMTIEFSYQACVEDSLCGLLCDGARVQILVRYADSEVIAWRSALRPNGNNPLWSIQILKNLAEASLKIVDRWGQIVHVQQYSEGINLRRGSTVAEAWDGRNDDGELLPQGAYYFLFTGITDENEEIDAISGVIYLMD